MIALAVVLGVLGLAWAAAATYLGRELLALERWRVEAARERVETARLDGLDEAIAALRLEVASTRRAADAAAARATSRQR